MGSSKTGLPARHSRVAKHEWHALQIPAVLEAVGTRQNGLTAVEADERVKRYGTNTFTETKKEPFALKVLKQVKSPLTVVLLVAFFITLALSQHIDATVIFLALLIAVVLGLFQEGKASRAFEKLAKSQVHRAVVLREGKRHEIGTEFLVPGDIVIMQSGMQVPADLRIIEAKKLTINESALTGEWLAVEKGTEPTDIGTPFSEIASMAWLGTFVATGHGVGVVVNTGDNTAMGEIARDLDRIADEETPIQGEMVKISRIMLAIVVSLVAGIFLVGIFRGESIETMLLTSIAIAVAAIPEGLPAAVTIILAVGMESLLSRGGLVRNLLAAETLGSTTYILTDKTGTLTEGKMAVTDMVYVGCLHHDEDCNCDWDEDEHAKDLLDIALCASDGYLDVEVGEDESYVVRGEPMERAILEAAHEVGILTTGESSRAQRIDFLSFESENRFAAGLTSRGEKKMLCINGAPELLLKESTEVMTAKSTQKLTRRTREYFETMIKKETSAGKRLIGIAYKSVSYSDIPENTKGMLERLVFAGLLIITDPIRNEVKEAIRGVLEAGAHVRLVTGDNPETALTIARKVGIAREHDVALTGDDMRGLSDEELLEVLQSVRVFARVLPRQKMRLAQVLQASGEIVAMTGDGINDAPALRKANIGVAIGSGTEVAKESSDLVLVNDSFSTIHAAIEEGRRIIGNLRKIVGYLLSTSLSEAVLIAGALISGGPIPILPAQILWANIIEEGLMSVAFAFEKGDKNAMKEKPMDIHEEGVISSAMLLFIVCAIGILSIVLLSLYSYLRIIEAPIAEIRSIMFIAISIDSLFMAFSFRSLTTPIWKIPLRNNVFFAISFLLNIALLSIVISVPALQKLLSYEPLAPRELLLPIMYGFSALVIIEIGKWAFFERKK